MSVEETTRIISEVTRLEKEGKLEEATALTRTIPMGADMADVLKRIHGVKWLLDGGYNVTDAVARFGNTWLHD